MPWGLLLTAGPMIRIMDNRGRGLEAGDSLPAVNYTVDVKVRSAELALRPRADPDSANGTTTRGADRCQGNTQGPGNSISDLTVVTKPLQLQPDYRLYNHRRDGLFPFFTQQQPPDLSTLALEVD